MPSCKSCYRVWASLLQRSHHSVAVGISVLNLAYWLQVEGSASCSQAELPRGGACEGAHRGRPRIQGGHVAVLRRLQESRGAVPAAQGALPPVREDLARRCQRRLGGPGGWKDTRTSGSLEGRRGGGRNPGAATCLPVDAPPVGSGGRRIRGCEP